MTTALRTITDSNTGITYTVLESFAFSENGWTERMHCRRGQGFSQGKMLYIGYTNGRQTQVAPTGAQYIASEWS